MIASQRRFERYPGERAPPFLVILGRGVQSTVVRQSQASPLPPKSIWHRPGRADTKRRAVDGRRDQSLLPSGCVAGRSLIAGRREHCPGSLDVGGVDRATATMGDFAQTPRSLCSDSLNTNMSSLGRQRPSSSAITCFSSIEILPNPSSPPAALATAVALPMMSFRSAERDSAPICGTTAAM